MIGRRSFLQAIGLGAAAAPLAPGVLANGAKGTLSMALPIGTLGEVTSYDTAGPQGASGWAEKKPQRNPLIDELFNQANAAERPFMMKVNGFDADLYSRHQPLTTLIRIQTQRDAARRSTAEALRERARALMKESFGL